LQVVTNLPIFFFSSGRRHTSSLRDGSSDVCSSDLDEWSSDCPHQSNGRTRHLVKSGAPCGRGAEPDRAPACCRRRNPPGSCPGRSEERRVGKECRSRGWPCHLKKKTMHELRHGL